mgnify:CR=1 FL=1
MAIECVTNDKLRDFRSILSSNLGDVFNKWFRGHHRTFSFLKNGKFIPENRLVYNPIVQSQGSSWHFPCEGSRWLCIKPESK